MYAFSLAAQVVIVTSIRQIFLILDHFFINVQITNRPPMAMLCYRGALQNVK